MGVAVFFLFECLVEASFDFVLTGVYGEGGCKGEGWGGWCVGGYLIREHSFVCLFCNKNTTRLCLHHQGAMLVSQVRGGDKACSVEVEALLHGCCQETLSHDVFRGILWQL